MKDLQNKVAIITGSSRGIGAEIARRLAAAGARVVINYVSRGRQLTRSMNQLRLQEESP